MSPIGAFRRLRPDAITSAIGVRAGRVAAAAFRYEAGYAASVLSQVPMIAARCSAIGRPGFGMGAAATAHMPKFRNKQRPEAAPSPLN